MSNKIKKQHRDWNKIVLGVINRKSSRKKKIIMGSPGSAQVTRCRLLETYPALFAKTDGSVLILSSAKF